MFAAFQATNVIKLFLVAEKLSGVIL
jgi:hypothetical protein